MINGSHVDLSAAVRGAMAGSLTREQARARVELLVNKYAAELPSGVSVTDVVDTVMAALLAGDTP